MRNLTVFIESAPLLLKAWCWGSTSVASDLFLMEFKTDSTGPG
jgi:hypothetical protein